MQSQIIPFIKVNKDTFIISFKNGVTITINIPDIKDVSLIEQIQSLFCSSSTWLRVGATYATGSCTEDITEQLTGMKGDRVVASAEELTDFLYNAKHYVFKV